MELPIKDMVLDIICKKGKIKQKNGGIIGGGRGSNLGLTGAGTEKEPLGWASVLVWIGK